MLSGLSMLIRGITGEMDGMDTPAQPSSFYSSFLLLFRRRRERGGVLTRPVGGSQVAAEDEVCMYDVPLLFWSRPALAPEPDEAGAWNV